MNQHTRSLIASGIAGVIRASRDGTSAQSEIGRELQRMADAPLTGPRFPSRPDVSCPVCNGRGLVPGGPDIIGLGNDEINCRDCDGTGVVEPDEHTESDRELFARFRDQLAEDPPCGSDDFEFQYEEMPE